MNHNIIKNPKLLLRILYKVSSILFVLIISSSIVIIFYPTKLLSVVKYTKVRSLVARFGYTLICIILGLKISTKGPKPNKPFILVSNHLSYLDIPLLGSIVGGIFLSKVDVKRYPIIGPISKLFGNLFVNRRDKSKIENVSFNIHSRYLDGEGIILFPEGTTSDGITVNSFKSSMFRDISSNHIAVNFSVIKYETPSGYNSARERVLWHRQTDIYDYIVKLLCLPKINATVVFGNEKVANSDRKTLAKELENRVSEVFQSLKT